MRVGGQRHAPAALSPEKTRYPLYRRLGGPQGRWGRVRKILIPSEFDHRTVQPVASRYTDWAIPAHKYTRRNISKDPNLQHRLRENAEPRKINDAQHIRKRVRISASRVIKDDPVKEGTFSCMLMVPLYYTRQWKYVRGSREGGSSLCYSLFGLLITQRGGVWAQK
jgi:hypothetical protein